jgi:hypothetical protein
VPPIRCHYADCINLDEGFCGASAVELDPEDGCLTYERGDVEILEEPWNGDEPLDELWDEDEDEGDVLFEEDDWYEDELENLE